MAKRNVYSLSKSRGRLGIQSFKSLAERMRLTNRFTLINSIDADLQKIWTDSNSEYIEADELIRSHATLPGAKKQQQQISQDKIWTHLKTLQIQGASLQTITDEIKERDILSWAAVLDQSSDLIYKFARKALQQVLPTASNLKRWNKIADPNCTLCKMNLPQTNKHVL